MPDYTVSMSVPVTITAANASEAWWVMARYFGCKSDGMPAAQWATAGVPFATDMATCTVVVPPGSKGKGKGQGG